MPITVAQALELEQLRPADVRAGRQGLARTVEHILLLGAAGPGPHPHALYLADPAAPHGPAAQCERIRALADQRGAGLLCRPSAAHPLAPEALALADQLAIPVVELAGGRPDADVVAAVMLALMHERTAALERQQLFQQQLIDLVLRGFGLGHLARAAAERLRRPVLVVDAHDEVQAAAGLDDAQRQQWQLLIARSRPARHRVLELPGGGRVAVFPLPGAQRPGWIATSHDDALGPEQQQAIGQAGAILALDLLKREGAAAAQRDRQAELLDALLAGRYDAEERLLRDADQLGWDLRRCRAVLVVRGAQPEPGRRAAPALGLVADAARRAGLASVACQHGEDTLVLAALAGTPQAMRAALHELAHTLRQALVDGQQRQCVVAGGSVVESPLALGASYRAALSALRLQPSLPGAPQVVSYEDAQLLILLSEFGERAEVRAWLRELLGPLIDYDQRNRTNLVQTLEVALDHGGVLTVAAEQLHIHTNTLKYRLQRIEEIVGHSPLDGTQRLAYHIAARLARLMA